MSDQYEINEFDQVVHWNCGHKVANGEREPTDWELQMVDEIKTLQASNTQLRAALENLIFTAEKLFADVPIVQRHTSDTMRVTHPIIEAASEALKEVG